MKPVLSFLFVTVLLALASLIPGPARAQDLLPADSARAMLRRPTLPDSQRLRAYFDLAQNLSLEDPGQAQTISRQGLNLARRLRRRQSTLLFINQLGYAELRAGNMSEAAHYFREVIKQATPPRRLREESSYTSALQGLATANVELQQFATALTYLREVVSRIRQFPPPSPSELSSTYLNISQTYLMWYQAKPVDSLLSRGLTYARRGLREANRIHDPADAATALMVLSSLQQMRQRPDSAIYYGQRSIAALRPLHQPVRLIPALSGLAETYVDQGGPWPEVVALAQEMLILSQQLHQTTGLAAAHSLLATAYEHQGNWRAAYQARQAGQAVFDTLSSQERRQGLARLTVEFDTERKEARIRELTQTQRLQQARAERQQARLWGLLGGAALLTLGLAVAAWLTLRLRRSRAALSIRNEQLAQARATQDRLYSVIGHDLRTPLTALEGLATLIDYYYQPAHRDAAAMLEVTAEVRQTTSQLTGLLDNLLHWAANQSGELAYRPEALDAGALLHESADLYAPAARARQVEIQVDVPADLPPLWADRNMTLTQLRNLLGNALKVAPPNSAITLSARATAEGVELAVADAGPGLSAAQLATLSQAAGQDSLSTRLPGQRGTGLGLPLVRQLARRQQGSFRLESAPGQGTTARIGLPVAQ